MKIDWGKVQQQIEAYKAARAARHDEVMRLERERDAAIKAGELAERQPVQYRQPKPKKPWYETELEPSVWKRGK